MPADSVTLVTAPLTLVEFDATGVLSPDGLVISHVADETVSPVVSQADQSKPYGRTASGSLSITYLFVSAILTGRVYSENSGFCLHLEGVAGHKAHRIGEGYSLAPISQAEGARDRHAACHLNSLTTISDGHCAR